MLNCSTVSRAALVSSFIMVRQCSCMRNVFLLSFPSILSPTQCFLPDIFLSLHQFLNLLPFPSSSWARRDLVCASCFSCFTTAGSFQQALCKWPVYKLQFMRGHLRHKLRYESLQLGNVSVCYFLHVFWWSACLWFLLVWIDSIIFCLPDKAKEWERYSQERQK